MRPLKSVLALTLGAVVLFSSSGCSPKEVQVQVNGTAGKLLDVVTSAISKNATLLVQDASTRVGKAATYKEGDDGSNWTIVGLCADAETIEAAKTIEVAVIPTSSASKEVEEDIKQGKFKSTVACDGLKYR